MSRIGKLPIPLPPKVEVTINGQEVTVKGPKGQLQLTLHPAIKVAIEDGQVVATRSTDGREDKALHGLTRSLLNNMIKGVTDGFVKQLTVEGVGYAGEVRGKDLVMKLGYSHEIVVKPPENITFEVERLSANMTNVRVRGIDKQVVGQIAANIRELRPPEPYLGKGVRYSDEIIRRKAGKAGKK